VAHPLLERRGELLASRLAPDPALAADEASVADGPSLADGRPRDSG